MPYFNRKRKFSQYASQAVKAYGMYKRARSYTKNITKKRSAPSAGITQQHDSRMVYRRKRMPYKKKKSWIRFSKKVKAVITKAVSTRTILHNNQVTTSAGQVGVPQSYQFHLLYGKKGDTANSALDSGVDDIWRSLTGTGTTVSNALKYHFTSAILDITCHNTGNATQEVDIYHIQFWKESNCTSPEAAVIRAQNDTPTGTSSTALLMSDRGATPFEFPMLIRNTGMKILKKIKYFVVPGQAITYQIRDSRNRVITGDEINDGSGTGAAPANGGEFVQPGWTQGVMIIHRPLPGVSVAAQNLVTGSTRKYSFKQIEDNQLVDGLAS